MGTNDIYNLLAERVWASVINVENWKSASLKIKRLDRNVGFESYYEDLKGDKVKVDTTGDHEASKAVHKLYEITQSSPFQYKNWNWAVFTLYPDNRFDIEYIWDQELQDRVDKFNR